MPVEDYGQVSHEPNEPLYKENAGGERILLCGAKKTKRGGVRCRALAGFGTDHPGYGTCKYHGGCMPGQITRAARVEIAEKLDGMRALGQINDRVGPEEALLIEISRSAAAVAYFDDIVARIPQDETWFGPNQVIIEQWNDQRILLRQTAKAIVAAGIAKRQVEIAEMQAKALVAVILAVVTAPEMSLNADQQSMARQLMAAKLRTLTIETSAA